MKKRALTLLLALVMCLSLCTPVMAEEVTPERTIVYTTTAEERDAIFEAEVEKLSQLFPMVLQEKLGINIRVRI